MTRLELSRPEDLPAQKALWKEAFGDSEEDIALFYDTCGRPEELLLLWEDGALVSMAALLPHTLGLPGGGEVRAAYVYALATAKACRGRGYARRLLAEADGRLRAWGMACATVVPAQPGLHRFFASAGFGPGFPLWRGEVRPEDLPAPAPESTLTPLTPEEYGVLRRELLEGLPAVHYGPRLLAFQAGMCRLAGGGLYRIAGREFTGCAAAEYRGEGRLTLKELLLPPERQGEGLALLAQALPARVYEVRTPVDWKGLPGGVWPFGRVKWYDLEQKTRFGPEGYLGLGFD